MLSLPASRQEPICKRGNSHGYTGRVNDSVMRLGVMQGEYHWHKHDNDDEFFLVLEGTFFVDLQDRVVELKPWQGFTVPKGVVHRTRAPERAVILMLETAAIVPTGD